MIEKAITEVKTRPLFYIFIVMLFFSIVFCDINLGTTRRNKSRQKRDEMVCEVYREPWNSSGDFVAIGEMNGKKTKILVKGDYINDDLREEILGKGTVILTNITLVKAGIEGNFYGFDYCKYLKSHGVDYYFYASDDSFSIQEKNSITIHSFGYYSYKVRGKIENSLGNYLGSETAGLIMSIMTGDTGGLEENTKNLLTRAGFSHLIAVSGAHIGYISLPVAIATKRSLLSLGKRKAIMLLPIILMWFIAGASCSVTRAVVMCIYSTLALVLKKQSDHLAGLGLAGIIQIGINPFSIYSMGFILSYGCALSIIILLPRIKGLFKEKHRILEKFLPGLAVNLGILPWTLYFFNAFSICGMILNIFASELAGALCIGGYLLFIIDSIPFLRNILYVLSNIMVSLSYMMQGLAEKVGGGINWFFRIETRTPEIWMIVIYYLTLIILLRLLMGKKVLVPTLATVLVAGLVLLSMTINKIEVLFFDTGQGLCALVRTTDGVCGLVDTGTGDVKVGELLRKEGVKKLDFIVISHGHSDHYGGLNEILESYEPKVIYVPKNDCDEYCISLIENNENNVVSVDRKLELYLGKYTTMTLLEYSYDTDELNNGSILVKLSGNWGNMLLPGDAEEDELSEMMENGFIGENDLLCLGHHGSITSGTKNFLCKVNPKYVIISVGYGNSYGHPSQIVLDRLIEIGVNEQNIYRTDQDGAIRITCGNRLFGKEFFRIWQKKWITA